MKIIGAMVIAAAFFASQLLRKTQPKGNLAPHLVGQYRRQVMSKRSQEKPKISRRAKANRVGWRQGPRTGFCSKEEEIVSTTSVSANVRPSFICPAFFICSAFY